MYRRVLGLLIALIILILPMDVAALTLPVSQVSGQNAVILLDETDARLISAEIDMYMQQDQTLVEQSIVIANNNKEEETRILVGIPRKIDGDKIDIDNIEAFVEGRKQSLRNRRNNTLPEDTSITDLPSNWTVLTLDLKPGEYKVVDYTYSIRNPMEQNGIQTLYLPIGYLKNWPGTTDNIRISLHNTDMKPYGFEPNPSVIPDISDDGSSITWQYRDHSIPDYIRLYYRSIDLIAMDYLTSQAPGDSNILNIIRAYEVKAYDECARLIDSLLEGQSELVLENELLFLKALAKQKLFQTNEAIHIYRTIENEPLYGEFEGTIKNKIIYERFNHLMSHNTPEEDRYRYLDDARQYVVNNTIFLNWLDEELSNLTPPAEPEPTPDPSSEEEPEEVEKQDDEDEEQELVKYISIFGKEIPVEILFVVGIVLLILIPYLIGRRRRKKTKYLFR